VVGLASLCAGLLWPAAAGLAADDPAKKAAELEQLRHRIERMQSDLQSDRRKKTRAEQRLQDVEQRINELRRTLRRTETRLNTLDNQLAGLLEERRAIASRLQQQSTALAREAVTVYARGRPQRLKLVLNQERPAAVGRVLTYFSYFSRARQSRIRDMRATLEHLRTLETDIDLKSRSLADLRREQRKQAGLLEAQRSKRERAVAALERRLKSLGGELERLQRDEKQLQALVRSLQELLADIPVDAGSRQPFGKLQGHLRWPLRGRLERRFGSSRGQTGFKWQGVVIAAPEGEAVHAVHQGRVAFADWMRGYGLLLIIDHGDGYMTLYGHNQALYKEVGEWVDSGEVVATSGASGGQSVTGLYFEIRHNGQPVNPVRWCAGNPSVVPG
jgi:septal ring factor EnvC (AmiA/AmiB activator)